MAFQGIDVRQTGDRIVVRVLLQDITGAILTAGTANLRLYELQNDGSLKSYDFNSNTFKTTALTTETQALTHRTGNNSTTNTGLWTFALTTLTGFTAGSICFAHVSHSSASPVVQVREFQFGVSGVFDLFDTATLSGVKAKTDLIPASPAAVGSPMTLEADAITNAVMHASALAEISASVLASAASDPIAANAKEMNDVPIQGTGVSGDKWRG